MIEVVMKKMEGIGTCKSKNLCTLYMYFLIPVPLVGIGIFDL